MGSDPAWPVPFWSCPRYPGDPEVHPCCPKLADFQLTIELGEPLQEGTYTIGENGVSGIFNRLWDHPGPNPQGACVCYYNSTRQNIPMPGGKVVVGRGMHPDTGEIFTVQVLDVAEVGEMPPTTISLATTEP